MPQEADVSAKFRLLKETGSVEIDRHEEPVIYALFSLLIRDANETNPLYVSAIDLGTTVRILEEIGESGRTNIEKICIVRRQLKPESPFLKRYHQNLAPIKHSFPGNVFEAVEGQDEVPIVPFHGIMFGNYVFFGMSHFRDQDEMHRQATLLAPSVVVDLEMLESKFSRLQRFFESIRYLSLD